MNKIKRLSIAVLFLSFIWGSHAFCESIDELVDEFGVEFESLKPLPNSSINADFKQAQIALGAVYTIKALRLLHIQNQELINKKDEIKDKYDEIIEQNRELIRLLSILVKKETKNNRLLSIMVKENLNESGTEYRFSDN
ncbi:hypothetical protein BuS5_03948 [Desulfosarcina sp. BuS5]|uniref:hypothetical protein n=1 Tax=Desulfosarcina sp. BuS5 TaxID=933262 RepID=UPI0004828A24|nr:hypothetical protein [Desulfosarcina sp. BuS5]WDN90977.1 hypothetical protein BuS5_03948 [Desulfosarcina sp. BuS5]